MNERRDVKSKNLKMIFRVENENRIPCVNRKIFFKAENSNEWRIIFTRQLFLQLVKPTIAYMSSSNRVSL